MRQPFADRLCPATLPALLLATLLGVLLSALPALAQVNPDSCQQVREDDVATLVTLNQSTVEPRDQTQPNECEWDVKTPLAVTSGEVQLTLTHFGSHAEAVAAMKNELPFYFDKAPPLVKTTGPDDHVDDLLNRTDWAQAEAVHGDEMAKVEVSQIDPAARAHASFEYRLQRLALQAAGATVLPTAGVAPDPVRPREQPDTTAHASSGSFFTQPSGIVLAVLAVLVAGAALRRVLRQRS